MNGSQNGYHNLITEANVLEKTDNDYSFLLFSVLLKATLTKSPYKYHPIAY